MGLINKERTLMDIASRIGKGAVVFEKGKCPKILMNGKDVLISSVCFSTDRGELTYKLSDMDGRELTSAFGERAVRGLNPSQLVAVAKSVVNATNTKAKRRAVINKLENRVQKSSGIHF